MSSGHHRTRTIVGLTLGALAFWIPAEAQIMVRPTPPPGVTAEGETWYASRSPILLDGNLYYPSGPVVHFNPHEMVRAGRLGDVPLYIRTTHEPRSIVYVPLGGGVVRPYERRRDGELAGTVGSRAPALPVVLPSAEDRDAAFPLRAPAPPTGVPVAARGQAGDAHVERTPQAVGSAVAGTMGTIPVASPEPPRLETARRPVGLDDVFIDVEGARWFLAGPVVQFSPDHFTAVGDYEGFTIYTGPERPGVIYVPTVSGEPGLLTPYRPR